MGGNGELINSGNQEQEDKNFENKNLREEFRIFLREKLKNDLSLADEIIQRLDDFVPINEILIAMQKVDGKKQPLFHPKLTVIEMDHIICELTRCKESVISKIRLDAYKKSHPLVQTPPKGGIVNFARNNRRFK